MIEAAAGRAAVICGVGASSGRRSPWPESRSAGATGILMLPARARSGRRDAGLLRRDRPQRGHRRAPYARDWAIFSPDLLARLAEEPNVVAYKDGSADLRLWARLGRASATVWCGWGASATTWCTPTSRRGGGLHLQRGQLHAPGLPRPLRRGEQRGLRPRRAIFEDKVGDFYALRARKRGYEVSSVKVAMEMCGLKAGSVPRSRRWGRRT